MISDEYPNIFVDISLLCYSQWRGYELEQRVVVLVPVASHLSTRELDLLKLLLSQTEVIRLVTVPQITYLVLHNLVDLLYLVLGQCRIRQAVQNRSFQTFDQSLDEFVNGDLSVGCDLLFLEVESIDALFAIHGLTCLEKSVLLTLGDFFAF